MRRTVSEILRRGFESTVANWPLLAIRIAEGILLVMLAIAAAFAIILPIIVSLGLSGIGRDSNPLDAAEAIMNGLASQWLVIVYALVVIMVVIAIFIAIHSFVIAGCARVFVDAERQSAAYTSPARDQLRAFTGERWLRGGREAWWPVFWIYNVAWSVAALILLVPLIAILVAVIVLRDNGPAAAIVGCGGLAIAVLFMIPVGIVTGIWTQKAIVDCLANATGVGDSLRTAWREFRSDIGRHLAIALVMMIVSFAAAMVFGSVGGVIGLMGRSSLSWSLGTLPLRFSASFANSIFSAAVGAWFLACFSALAVEPRR